MLKPIFIYNQPEYTILEGSKSSFPKKYHPKSTPIRQEISNFQGEIPLPERPENPLK